MKFTYDGTIEDFFALFHTRNDIMALRDEFRAAIATLRDENVQTREGVTAVLNVLTQARDEIAALRDQMHDAIEQEDLDALKDIKAELDTIQASMNAAIQQGGGGETVPGGNEPVPPGEGTMAGGDPA